MRYCFVRGLIEIMVVLLVILLFFCGCERSCNFDNYSNFLFTPQYDGTLCTRAKIHEKRLKDYFLNGWSVVNKEKLIAETKEIADKLKEIAPDISERFYSYCDVMLYGDQAIATSIKDMLVLTNRYECGDDTLEWTCCKC